jgi:peptidoglycan hydrolase-like protein with peptidoglycan-binding domain
VKKSFISGIILTIALISFVGFSYAADGTFFEDERYSIGDESKDIKLIKTVMKLEGLYIGEINNQYGQELYDAMVKYQTKYNVAASGNVGEDTLKVLNRSSNLPYLKLKYYEKGMTFDDIVFIKSAMKSMGYFQSTMFTFDFDEELFNAVKNFQADNGLDSTGNVDVAVVDKLSELGYIVTEDNFRLIESYTMGKLSKSVYRPGESGQDIMTIQKVLLHEGFIDPTKLTGLYDEYTESCVKSYQEFIEVENDGIVGPQTINKFVELELIEGREVVSSRGRERMFGEYLNWWKEVKPMLKRNETIFEVVDFETKKAFTLKVTAGTNHADCEAMTLDDTNVIKDIWGGFTWERRPVLVYLDGRVLAASMTAMPHAGRDDVKGGVYTSGRSKGYGYGYNLDFVKNNGMDGVVDLHFKNSRRHKDNSSDPKHQTAIKISAGITR